MKKAELIREYLDDCTVGQLALGPLSLFTLEPKWADNAKNESCIPPGLYKCIMRKSPRYGWKYWLQGTAPRTFILIHGGNVVSHTKGCILPGKRRGHLNGKMAVLNSKAAVSLIHDYFELEDFILEIKDE